MRTKRKDFSPKKKEEIANKRHVNGPFIGLTCDDSDRDDCKIALGPGSARIHLSFISEQSQIKVEPSELFIGEQSQVKVKPSDLFIGEQSQVKVKPSDFFIGEQSQVKVEPSDFDEHSSDLFAVPDQADLDSWESNTLPTEKKKIGGTVLQR